MIATNPAAAGGGSEVVKSVINPLPLLTRLDLVPDDVIVLQQNMLAPVEGLLVLELHVAEPVQADNPPAC